MGVKGQTDDFRSVALHCGQALPVVRVPNLRSLVKGPSGYPITERIIEREAVHNVLVAHQAQELSAGLGVPELAGPVVASCDEPREQCLQVASLVEGAVGQWLLVSLQLFEYAEFLDLVRQHLCLEFWSEQGTVDELN